MQTYIDDIVRINNYISFPNKTLKILRVALSRKQILPELFTYAKNWYISLVTRLHLSSSLVYSDRFYSEGHARRK